MRTAHGSLSSQLNMGSLFSGSTAAAFLYQGLRCRALRKHVSSHDCFHVIDFAVLNNGVDLAGVLDIREGVPVHDDHVCEFARLDAAQVGIGTERLGRVYRCGLKPLARCHAAPPPAKPVTTAAEYQQQGRKLIQEEQFAEAIEPLTQAVKRDPFLATTFNARGYAYFRLKKYQEAVADFDQAIQLNPLYGNAYTNRGAAKRAAGDKAGADADQAKARDLLKAPAK